MRVNDAVTGAVLLVLSLAVVWHVRSFPTIPGQPYGAALYPLLVGCGLGYVASLAKAARDATRYRTMEANFAEVLGLKTPTPDEPKPKDRLADARAAAAADDENGVLDYVNSVHAMMSLESNDWVRLGQIEWGQADPGLRQEAAQARAP